MGDNKSRMIVSGNKVAIGPGVLSVGCKHPYLFGCCADGDGDTSCRYFVMDIRDREIEWLDEENAFMMFERLGLSLDECKGIGMLIASPDHKKMVQDLTNSIKGDSSHDHETP